MEWIKSEDRLPEATPATLHKAAVETDIVLVFDEHELIGMAFYCHEEEDWYREDGHYYVGFISHWMPLPEPPKEKEGVKIVHLPPDIYKGEPIKFTPRTITIYNNDQLNDAAKEHGYPLDITIIDVA